ncbi:MAG: gliding motility protein GldN [Chitinophagales bacterium]
MKSPLLLLSLLGFGASILSAQNPDNFTFTTETEYSTGLVELHPLQKVADTKPKQKESYTEEKSETPKANIPQNKVIDGAYVRHIAKDRKPLPYPNIREADVFWQKRIWREVNVHQKMNQIFADSRDPFVNVLMDIAAQKEDAYIFADEDFKTPIPILEVKKSLGLTDTILVIDPYTYQEYTEIVTNEFNWQTVETFRFKEDWIFDENTSRMHIRILGIAPVVNVVDDNGELRGQRTLFWAYYPSFRKYLVNVETYNRLNDGMRLTWDDILEARMFVSNIVKESNIFDRRIKDYAVGKDALMESERIKQEIMEIEHNLWSY